MSVWLAGVVLEALRNADDQAVFEDVKVKSIMKVEKECDMNTKKLYYKNIQSQRLPNYTCSCVSSKPLE